jgi:hypothetical protein
MSRRRKRQTEEAPPQLPIGAALGIHADAVYRAEAVRAALGLGASAIRREWRAGRLKIRRRCNRNYILGRDLIEWLEAGELPSPSLRLRDDDPAA